MRYDRWLIAMIFVMVVASARAVDKGDSREDVIRELGQPERSFKDGDYEMLTYARGRVELLKGVVADAKLISVEELKKRAKKKAAVKVSPHEAKAALLASAEYQKMSPGKKVAALRDLHRRFPKTDLTDELLNVVTELEFERRDAARDAEITMLKEQLSDAQLEAIRARKSAEKAHENSNSRWDNNYYHYPPIYLERSGYFSIGHNSPGSQFGPPRVPVVRPKR